MKIKGLFISFLILFLFTASLCFAQEYSAGEKQYLNRTPFGNAMDFRNPAITFTNNKEIVIAFTTSSGRTGAGLFVQKLDKNLKQLTKAIRLADDSLPKFFLTSITNPVTGSILLVWQEGRRAQKLKAVLLAKDLSIINTFENIADSPSIQQEPSLAVNTKGFFALSWTNWKENTNKPDNYDVYIKIFGNGMDVLKSTYGVALGSQKQNKPSAVFFSDEIISVVYSVLSSPVALGQDIMMKNYNIETDFKFNEAELESAQEDQQNPKAIAIGDNKALVIWEDTRNNNYDVYAKVINEQGSALKEFVIVRSLEDEKTPVIAKAGGNILVAWIERNSRDIIKAQLFDNNAEKQGEVITIDDQYSFKTNLAIAAHDSDFAVAYEDYIKPQRNIVIIKISAEKTVSKEKEITQDSVIEEPLLIERPKPCLAKNIFVSILNLIIKMYKFT